jgi:hypothetical protein
MAERRCKPGGAAAWLGVGVADLERVLADMVAALLSSHSLRGPDAVYVPGG